ncbi:MAG: rfaE bifunctional protein kinase chain/domain [Cyclobacteriaceae bacterium]|jgi:rfaE bifunctional protein kinase chain/domain
MTYNSIAEIIDAFQHLKVLIIGDVMIDSYIYGSTNRISPEAPVPVVQVTRKEKRLGGAANVALNIQALGAEPVLCSIIGDDANGVDFINLLNKQNISSEGIIQSKNRITTVKQRVLAGSQQMLRIDEESENRLDSIEEKSLMSHIDNLLRSVDLVIFEDYDKGTLNGRVIAKTIELANELSIPSVVDPKKKNFNLYRDTTLFKPNLKELKDGLQQEVDGNSLESLDRAIEELIKEKGHKKVMITLSENGIYLKGETGRQAIPAHLRSIADVSGAGDTVVSIAGLCVGLGLSDQITADLSNLGGGLVCESLGVVPIDKDQLLKEASSLKIR